MNTFNITRHFAVYVAQIYRGLGSVLQTKKLCLDRDNIVSEISTLSTEDKLLLTSPIFRSEKESVKADILSCSQTVVSRVSSTNYGQTYKNLPPMLNVTPRTWIQGGNSVLTCAINARESQASYIHTYIHTLLTTSPKGLFSAYYKEEGKTVIADQLYSNLQPSFVSQIKLALNINDKIHHAGGTPLSWPGIRKWTVYKELTGNKSVYLPVSVWHLFIPMEQCSWIEILLQGKKHTFWKMVK